MAVNEWGDELAEGAAATGTDQVNQKPPARAAKRHAAREDRIAVTAKSNTNAPLSDTQDQLADSFSQRYASVLRHVATWKSWLHWDGTRWRLEETKFAQDLARDVCREFSKNLQDPAMATKAWVNAVEGLAQADRRHAMRSDIWDTNLDAINTPGGTIDLTSGELRPHRQEDHISKITRGTPRRCGCPQWREFLRQITNGDSEFQDFLQRIAGYSLTGSVKEQKLFFYFGPGGNGKGVYLNTIGYVLGEYVRVAAAEMFMQVFGTQHPTDIAGLRGARFVLSQETEKNARWAKSKVKALTGGDPITARFMRADFFDFVPQFKLHIAGNNKPGFSGVDHAIKRRIMLLPFLRIFDKPDLDLPERLKAEADGIMAWLIEGCMKWRERGLSDIPRAVRDATDDYLTEEDRLGRWLAERCDIALGNWNAANDLFDDYARWCETNHERHDSSTWFGTELGKRGFPKQKQGEARGRQGLALKPSKSRVLDFNNAPRQYRD